MNVLYYVRGMKEGNIYVPVFSLVGIIGMALIVRNRYENLVWGRWSWSMLRSLSTWDFVKIIGNRTTEEGGEWKKSCECDEW